MQTSDEMNERLYEHPDFVWLEKEALWELLRRRKPATCDALVVYNNLLKWCNDSNQFPLQTKKQFVFFPPGPCIRSTARPASARTRTGSQRKSASRRGWSGSRQLR